MCANVSELNNKNWKLLEKDNAEKLDNKGVH